MADHLSSYFILVNDLDSSTPGYSTYASSSANGGSGWLPIDGLNSPGNFNGQNHTISDLYINRPTTDNVGLFGIIGDGGFIHDVGVINANVTGQDGTGILLGGSYPVANWQIWSSYTTGNVNGRVEVGGLVGTFAYGFVYDSYSNANVTGDDTAGGLAGVVYFANTADNLYSNGLVTASANAGGLMGVVTSSSVTSSFWDNETSGQSSSAGGSGRRTSQMQSIETFSGAGWDIVQDSSYTNETWKINNGSNYPRLGWESPGGDSTPPTYSGNQTNNTQISLSTNFSLTVNDETALNPNGYYIFSTNNTGTWVNDSSINFTSTPSQINITKTLNSTQGINIGWRYYLYDNVLNENVTEVFNLITTGADSCSYSSGDWNIDCSDNCIISSDVDVGGNNIYMTGTGTFQINNGVSISNYLYRRADIACYVHANGNGGFYQ